MELLSTTWTFKNAISLPTNQNIECAPEWELAFFVIQLNNGSKYAYISINSSIIQYGQLGSGPLTVYQSGSWVDNAFKTITFIEEPTFKSNNTYIYSAGLSWFQANATQTFQASQYLVQASQLTSIANAIRAKTGGTTSLAFPVGFISAIGEIETGGVGYTIDDIALRNISIASGSASKIGQFAFGCCSTLTTANFPIATNIETQAFAYCSALTTINFPQVLNISINAFTNCSALTTINFPMAQVIQNSAFTYCEALTTINFPEVSRIVASGFYACHALTTTNFPKATYIGQQTFGFCYALTTVNFPLLQSMGLQAFRNCSMLTTINFPMCIYIGASAFQSCSALTSAYFLGSTYISLPNSNAFYSTPMSISTYTGSFGSIYVPDTMLASYKTRANWSYYSNRLVGVPVLYTSGTAIASNAYKSASYWGVYGSQCTSIGSSAFQSCTSLVTAYFSVCTTIEAYAFSSCSALTTIHFPACSYINICAFFSCSALTFANFPSCTTVGSYAFDNCSALTIANFPVCTTIGGFAFDYCSILTTINFPVCTTIGVSAFYECRALTSANFPVCTSIGSNAFYYCIALTTISFPACTFIGEYAFYSCRSLISADFPACTSIESNAFKYCSALTSAYFLNSTYITLNNSNAFNNTPMLNSTYTGTFGSIYVRASMLSSYKTYANWSYYSSRFVGLTDEQIATLNL